MVYLIIEWIERELVAYQGVEITMHSSKTLEECKIWCGETDGCNSFSWSSQYGCFLKEKCVTGDEASNAGSSNGYKSYYKLCTESGMRKVLKHKRLKIFHKILK